MIKQHRILVLVMVCLIAAFARSGDTGVQELSASAAPYYHHWANVYSLQYSYAGGYNGYSPARVRETADGGFAVGMSKWEDSACNGEEQMSVLKLDASGQAKWGIIPLTSGDDGACSVRSLAVLSDGRIAVSAQYFESWDNPTSYIALMVLDRNGTVQWIKTFLGSDVYDLQPTTNGGLLLTGRLEQGPWVAKLNSKGKIVWQARLDASILSIQQTPDGGFIGVGVNGGDAWIVKFDALGKITWQRSLGDPAAADGFHRVILMGDGYAGVGETQGLGASVQDLWVVKFDFLGHVCWQKAFGRRGPGHSNVATAIVRLHEGGYLLCGNSDYGFALRLDPSGNLLWGRKYSAWLRDALQTRQGDLVLIGKQILPDTCYPIGDENSDYAFAARVDALGLIGPGCCLIGAADVAGRKTVAVPYDTHFSTYHSPASVGSLSPTDSGYNPVTVYNVCLADLK